jgi:hypothetical protein
MKWVDQFALLALLAFLFAYFAFGIWINDLPVPGVRSGGVAHLHGVSIWLLLGAFLCYVIYRIWFLPKEDTDCYPLGVASIRIQDLFAWHSGRVAFVLGCVGWLLFLASLISMFFVRA